MFELPSRSEEKRSDWPPGIHAEGTLLVPSRVRRRGEPRPCLASSGATYKSLRYPELTKTSCLPSALMLRSVRERPAQFVMRRGAPEAFAPEESAGISQIFESF